MLSERRTHNTRPWQRAAEEGFTIVEILVAVAIFVLVSALSLITFNAAIESRRTATARVEVFETARSIVNLISQDLKTAYLSPESTEIEPAGMTPGSQSGFTPKFAGYSLEVPALYYLNVDNDGDGQIDEDPIDGLDNDGDGLIDEDFGRHRLDQYQIDNDEDGNVDEDPLNGIDDDGDGRVDEDYATYPRDLLLFSSAQDNPGIYDLTQIGYTLGYDLTPVGNNAVGVTELRRMYVSADTTGELTFPIADFANETDYVIDRMNGVDGISGFTANDTVAFNVLGLDFKFFYYNYVPGAQRWEVVEEWDSTREVYPNEPEDIPTGPGLDLESALRHSDGLPLLVEIRIYVQDDEGVEDPRLIIQRVSLAQSAL